MKPYTAIIIYRDKTDENPEKSKYKVFMYKENEFKPDVELTTTYDNIHKIITQKTKQR